MAKQLINKNILLLSIMLLGLQAVAVTHKELIHIDNIIKEQCNINMRDDCKLYINKDDDSINAYSLIDGRIVISQGIINTFNKNELLAVTLHECGHMVNRDPETVAYIAVHYPHIVDSKYYRHKIEYKADLFASNYFYSRCQHNYIYDAFKKLNKADWNKESNTHPSLNNRIKNIQKYEKFYVTKCKYINK